MAVEQPEKIIAVADASFLIGVCLIDQIESLGKLVGHVYVAPAVWKEVVVRGKGKPGAQEIEHSAFIEQHPIRNKQAVEMLKVFLGPGEAETLVLAQELQCSLVFLDELKARKAAQQAGMRTIGVVGLLLTAKRQGLIGEIRPLLETLIQRGFRLGRTLVEEALRDTGEMIL